MTLDPNELRVQRFTATDTDVVRACQALRYRVYHHELGLDTPDMDHQLGLDVERRDPTCDFLVARDRAGQVLGCVRLQVDRPPSFYAEDEFELTDPFWSSQRFAEGARFVVEPALRDSVVPIALFSAFRDACRAEGIKQLLSVAIVSGALQDRRRLAGLVRFLLPRVKLAAQRARPAAGYELPLSDRDELAATEPTTDVPPMLRLLASGRTTLCSAPAYCRRFGTFNFLLVTRL